MLLAEGLLPSGQPASRLVVAHSWKPDKVDDPVAVRVVEHDEELVDGGDMPVAAPRRSEMLLAEGVPPGQPASRLVVALSQQPARVDDLVVVCMAEHDEVSVGGGYVRVAAPWRP